MASASDSKRIAVFTSPKCVLHYPKQKFTGGKLNPYPEVPDRLLRIQSALRGSALINFFEVDENDHKKESEDLISLVHDASYLNWLKNVWATAHKRGYVEKGKSLVPDTFLHRSLLNKAESDAFPDYLSRLESMDPLASSGLFSFDMSAPVVEETYENAWVAAHCAVHAARSFINDPAGLPAVFALVRPPGHHSCSNLCGGFCYLNNAAIATLALSRFHHERSLISQDLTRTSDSSPNSPHRIAIIDIDYHPGNGTSKFFSEWNAGIRKGTQSSDEAVNNPQVFYLSLHGEGDWPFFTNPRNDDGDGLKLNVPLPPGIKDEAYLQTLMFSLDTVAAFNPDHLVVSLGVDTSASDPIQSQMFLSPECYPKIGAAIAQLGRRALFVMEGGYDLDTIGESVRGVLEGFAVSFKDS